MRLFTKTDWLFALAATLIVLLFGSLSLTTGIYPWGDDCAAYISEGIAIANDKLAEVIEKKKEYLASEVLATEITNGTGDNSKEWNVNGEKITFSVVKA